MRLSTLVVWILCIAPTASHADTGTTYEASLGVGRIRAISPRLVQPTVGPMAVLGLGIGRWLNSRASLAVRGVFGTCEVDSGGPDTFINFRGSGVREVVGMVAASMQLWFANRLWVGAGFGGAFNQFSHPERTGFASETGVGAYVRSGVTFAAFNVALEYGYTWMDSGYQWEMITLQLGYQPH
ncbi:MAG: hypothetical protein ABI867_25015 [Kofleriaceae bacterium]